MSQRQRDHFGCRFLLSSLLLSAVALAGVAPRASHARRLCAPEFHEQTIGTSRNGEALCHTAVNGECVFQLMLCVNQGNECTPTDFKTKRIKASGRCGEINVSTNGTEAVCGMPANITVRTRKHQTKTGKCKIHAKAGRALGRITLRCQPPARMCRSTTTTTSTPTTTTTTDCCASNPKTLSFTTGIGNGNCGTIETSMGMTKHLACGGLYTGAGGNTVPLPYRVPDMGESVYGVSACSGTTLTLTNLTSAQTGSDRNCTSVGCLFSAPLPIPNSVSTPASVCVINSVAADASGSADWSTGASSLDLPLTSTLYLTGDLLPNRAGIQACPVCLAGACVGDAGHNGIDCTVSSDCGSGTCATATTCHGGLNDGRSCTPADSAVNPSFPTTHDCPPPTGASIGGLPIALALTTGTVTLTARNNTASGQNGVFCGYCRDHGGGMSAGTGCFEGDPDPACPANSACTAPSLPQLCCTGTGTGTCDQPAPKACTSNADCTDGNGTWPDCMQGRTPGAFGPAGGGARTLTETGVPSGYLCDRRKHDSTLVSIFCIPPTFNATVDAAGDLPGPGAISIPGMAQLQ